MLKYTTKHWLACHISNRYITDRFLPDKAIDLVDEACATIKTEMNSMPTELDEEIRRKIMQQEIEEAALKKKMINFLKNSLKMFQKELAEYRSDLAAMKAQWENEMSDINKVRV